MTHNSGSKCQTHRSSPSSGHMPQAIRCFG